MHKVHWHKHMFIINEGLCFYYEKDGCIVKVVTDHVEHYVTTVSACKIYNRKNSVISVTFGKFRFISEEIAEGSRL